MPLWNSVTTLLASNSGRHTILVFGLVVVMFATAYLTGLYARSQASVFLCQYDPESLSNCAKILELPNLTGIGNANSASPTPTEVANANQGTTHLGDRLNTNTGTTNSGSGEIPNSSVSTTVVKDSTQSSQKTVELDAAQKARLTGQSVQVKNLVRHHGRVMALFYGAYYQALSVVLLMGVIAAMALFGIAQDGWKSASPYVKTVFLVATAGVAFFGLWPAVFEQEKNISDNKALFLEYERLGNEIASYPVTRSNVKNESTEPNIFINYVDSEMSRLGNIAIGFDYTKISYKGAFEINPNSALTTPSPEMQKKKKE